MYPKSNLGRVLEQCAEFELSVRVEVGAEEVALVRAAGQHRHHVPRVQTRAHLRPGRNIARWGETIVSLEPEGREFDSGPIYMYIHIHL